jgi:hypothetical protein
MGAWPGPREVLQFAAVKKLTTALTVLECLIAGVVNEVLLGF